MEAFLGPGHFCCLERAAGARWLSRKGRKGMHAAVQGRAASVCCWQPGKFHLGYSWVEEE